MMSAGAHKHVFEFSSNNKYFALINNDGKLMIWDTENSSLGHSYVLSTSSIINYTALCWIVEHSKGKVNKNFLALGTSNGKIEIFSHGTGKIEYNFKGTGHAGQITALFFDSKDSVFSSGLDAKIIKWNINKKSQVSVIKLGVEVIYSMNILSNNCIVTGGRHLNLWNLKNNQNPLKTFSGHTSNVTIIKRFEYNSEDYIVTAAAMDRVIYIWNLNVNSNSIATLLIEDIAVDIKCMIENENLKIIAVTRSGKLHYFNINFEQINNEKPLKSQVTLEIASDSNSGVEIIPLVSSNFHNSSSIKEELLIAYGNEPFLVFEELKLNLETKNQVEVRDNSKKIAQKNEINKSNLINTEIDYDKIEYQNANLINRKSTNVKELPMETRLENLTLDVGNKKVKKGSNLTQLLIQGLHSKDNSILRLVFSNTNANVIKSTLSRLPSQYVFALVDELNEMMNKKGTGISTAVKWLHALVFTQSSQLMSLGEEELFDRFGPTVGIIEQRIQSLPSLTRVRGRLDLLVNQIKRKDTESLDESNLLVYQDKNSSDELSDDEVMDDASSTDYYDLNEDDIDGKDEEDAEISNSNNEDDDDEDDDDEDDDEEEMDLSENE